MNLVKKISFLFFLTLFLSGSLKAAELIMVEQQGCYYCLEWKDQLGHIYPKTPEGKFAPLKTRDSLALPSPIFQFLLYNSRKGTAPYGKKCNLKDVPSLLFAEEEQNFLPLLLPL